MGFSVGLTGWWKGSQPFYYNIWLCSWALVAAPPIESRHLMFHILWVCLGLGWCTLLKPSLWGHDWLRFFSSGLAELLYSQSRVSWSAVIICTLVLLVLTPDLVRMFQSPFPSADILLAIPSRAPSMTMESLGVTWGVCGWGVSHACCCFVLDSGLRTAGVHIPHPILDLFTFVNVSLECFRGLWIRCRLVRSLHRLRLLRLFVWYWRVPTSQPSQAPTSAIVCAILEGSDLSQRAASAPGWFDNSVNVGFSSSSEERFAPCVSFVMPQVVTGVAFLSLFWSLLLPLRRPACFGFADLL